MMAEFLFLGLEWYENAFLFWAELFFKDTAGKQWSV